MACPEERKAWPLGSGRDWRALGSVTLQPKWSRAPIVRQVTVNGYSANHGVIPLDRPMSGSCRRIPLGEEFHTSNTELECPPAVGSERSPAHRGTTSPRLCRQWDIG